MELRSDDGRASGGGDVGSGDDRSPRLSIGLPVYNGERYLEQSIESILGQTFTDFELIICDNASTDDTATICRRYVEVDPRVRYHRNPENIGGANNHNLTFELSRGELFRWASYDDVCAPELFEHCVEILDADPSIVLCHSAVASIDEAGDRIEVISRNHAMSDRPSQRFASVAVSRDYCEETYGIIRSDVFGSTRLQQNYTGSDRTLLSELALHGRFHQVPEVLFFKRMHEANRYVDWRTRSTWFDPAAGGTVSFPFWTQFADYVHTIGRVPIGLRERVSCYGFMAQWATRNSLKLVKDLLMAAYLAAHGPEWRRRRHRQTENWEVSGTGDRPARRVGLMGFFGYGNLGDEVVQNTVMRNLGARLDEVDFVGFSLEPADTEARHGIPSHPLSRIDDGADDGDGAAPGLSVRIARWMGNSRLGPVRRLERWAIRLPLEVGMAVDAFRNLRGLDALIVSGSGPLTDYWGGGGAMSFPYTLAKWTLLARARGIPVIFLSVGAGPIHSRASAAFIELALRAATYRSFRDEFSRELVTGKGARGDDAVTPDMAHSLPIESVNVDDARRDRPMVGLNVMGYFMDGCWPESDAATGDQHLKKYTEFVTWLIERGHSVVLLPGEAHFDQLVFDALLDSLAKVGLREDGTSLIRPRVETADELIDWLQRADVVVASRFHLVLLGQRCGTPTIAVSYQEKIDVLMDETGLGDHCYSIADFRTEDLVSSFEAVEARIEEIGEHVSAYSHDCEGPLAEQYDRVIELI